MSEQAKVRKLSMGGQMLIGCDDDGEGLHLRVTRCENIIAVEIHKYGKAYKPMAFEAPEGWSGHMVRKMATSIFNGLRSWSGRTQRKRANSKAKKDLERPTERPLAKLEEPKEEE